MVSVIDTSDAAGSPPGEAGPKSEAGADFLSKDLINLDAELPMLGVGGVEGELGQLGEVGSGVGATSGEGGRGSSQAACTAGSGEGGSGLVGRDCSSRYEAGTITDNAVWGVVGSGLVEASARPELNGKLTDGFREAISATQQ